MPERECTIVPAVSLQALLTKMFDILPNDKIVRLQYVGSIEAIDSKG